MNDAPEISARRVIRVTAGGSPAFQLRKGEEGLSVFDPDAVVPPLSEEEILDTFRPGSLTVVRSVADIETKGLQIIPLEGADTLPDRLRQAHHEIRPGTSMSRADFKRALRELE